MKTKHIFKKTIALLTICILSLAGCQEEGDDDGGTSTGQGGSQDAISTKLDLTDSSGLLVTNGASSESASIHRKNAEYLGIEPNTAVFTNTIKSSGDGSDVNLQKVDSDGAVSPVLEWSSEYEGGSQITEIRSIGISPAGEVYLHFEHPFIYRNTDDDGAACSEPWEAESPCSCQIFKSTATVSEYLDGTEQADFGNLECLDNYHYINNWNQTGNVFQFDDDSNIYYLATIPNSSQSVLYKTAQEKVDGVFTQTEMVNSSICINDYRVSGNGGLFYVGQNCIDGNWSSGADGSFFRYVSPDGTLTEIARNWWDFTFEIIEGESSDKVLFFGPDPDSSEVATWDSACLFEFDPSQATGSQATRLVTCNQHIWDWLELRHEEDIATYGNYRPWDQPPATWRSEFKNRCINDSDTFIGGSTGSPVRNIKQTSAGLAYIVGNISKKNAGSFSCNVEVRGYHCEISSIPAIRDESGDDYVQASCETDGGTWTLDGWCDGAAYNNPTDCGTNGGTWYTNSNYYNDVDYIIPDTPGDPTTYAGHICLEDGETTTSWNAIASDSVDLKLRIQNVNCSEPSEGWVTEYKGLAYVNKTSNQLELKSTTTEQVADMWLVNGTLYYTAFESSQYTFVQEVNGSDNTTLLTDFEVYHVNASPRGGSLVLFDGLDFTNNSYTFGDLNPNAGSPEDVKDSIFSATGLTGRIRTVIIYGTE